MLQDSLFLMMVAADTEGGPAHQELEKLAVRYSRDRLDVFAHSRGGVARHPGGWHRAFEV